jgi:hypothetical protein
MLIVDARSVVEIENNRMLRNTCTHHENNNVLSVIKYLNAAT